MLNISNLERIAEILGMDPENITEFDIEDASDELDPNSEEWLIMIEALRELDGGKSNEIFEHMQRKYNEGEVNKMKLTVKEIFKMALSDLLIKFRIVKSDKEIKDMTNEELESKLEKANETIEIVIDEENLTTKEIVDKKIVRDDAKILKEKIEKEKSIRDIKEIMRLIRKNNKIEWLKIKLAGIGLLILAPINITLIGLTMLFNLISSLLLVAERKLFIG